MLIADILTSIEKLQSDSFDASRSYNERRRSFAQLWQKILEIRQIGDQKLELTSSMLETVRVIPLLCSLVSLSLQAEEYSRRLDISVKTMEKSRHIDDYFLNSIANIPRPDSVGMSFVLCMIIRDRLIDRYIAISQ